MSNGRDRNNNASKDYVPALDGIRGYGFLAVFLFHYFANTIEDHRSNIVFNALYYLEQIAWLAVPSFFVLSGYLIGGNLFATQNREGFFRVFYYRRMLRVLPVYYLTLLVVGCIDQAHGIHLDYHFWTHLIYVQNLMPGYSGSSFKFEHIRHLWSLAIEEQFYLTWPIVVFFAKDRARLLKIIAFLCAVSWSVRLLAPWLHISTSVSYFATPMRIDTILFGVALSLLVGHRFYQRLQPFAKYAAILGVVLWLVSFSTHPDNPNNYSRVAFEFTLANLTLVATIAALLEKGSVAARVCSVEWICWLGKRSYALYVFHYTYCKWFRHSFRAWLAQYMNGHLATITTAAIAFAITIALAMFSYRLIEHPILGLKKYVNYGPDRTKTPVESQHVPAFFHSDNHPASLRRPPAQDGLARGLDLVETRDTRGMGR